MSTDKKSSPGGAGAGGAGGDKKDEKKEDIMKIWNDSEVQLLKKWGETAASYRLLHDRAYRYYEVRAFRYNVPIIILSTVTGTASFSQTLFPIEYQPFVPMVIGSLNIFTGILGTLSRFYRLDELTESHRVASISYGKYSRNISTELSLPPTNRRYHGADMVEMCRSEMDRLIEQSPIIPMFILLEFKNNADYKFINKPEVLDIKPIEEYKMSKEEKVVEIVTSVVERLKQLKPEKTMVQQMAERHGTGGMGGAGGMGGMGGMGGASMGPPSKQTLQNIVHNAMMNRDSTGAVQTDVRSALRRPSSFNVGNGNIPGANRIQDMIAGAPGAPGAVATMTGVDPDMAIDMAMDMRANVIPTAESIMGKAEQLVAEQRENIMSEIENVITPGTVSAAKSLFRNMAKKAVSRDRLSQAARSIIHTAAQSTVPNIMEDVQRAAADIENGLYGIAIGEGSDDGNGGGNGGSSP